MSVVPAKFDVNRCNESPLRGEKPDFWPVSKFNTGSLPLRGILPVIKTEKRQIIIDKSRRKTLAVSRAPSRSPCEWTELSTTPSGRRSGRRAARRRREGDYETGRYTGSLQPSNNRAHTLRQVTSRRVAMATDAAAAEAARRYCDAAANGVFHLIHGNDRLPTRVRGISSIQGLPRTSSKTAINCWTRCSGSLLRAACPR